MPKLEPRSPDKIDPTLRANLRAVCMGQKEWPLFIHGEPGSGKTFAALCLADRCVGPCRYYTVDRLADDHSLAKKGELDLGWRKVSLLGLWNEWERCQLTILDELGLRKNPSDSHYEAVKRAIDLRENQPAIYIANADLETLAARYDDRMCSRLGSGTVVHVAGDRRVPF